MNSTSPREKRAAALDDILLRDGAHHLEIHYDEDGSIDSVASADARWRELATYERDDLTAEERRQAEALFEPDGVVYPDSDD